MEHSESQSQLPPPDTTSTTRNTSRPFWKWFWLSFLVVSLGYAWYSFYVPSNDVAWADDIAAARQLAEASDKPMLLFFTAEWCVPCRIMKREVFADSDVATAVNARVVPVMIHQGSAEGNELFGHYQVGTTPVTIFTDPGGDVLDYEVGGIGRARFMEMLANLDDEAIGARGNEVNEVARIGA